MEDAFLRVGDWWLVDGASSPFVFLLSCSGTKFFAFLVPEDYQSFYVFLNVIFKA
jgi:hypothetical protein